MELIHFSFQNYTKLGPIVVALGQFDGLHLAHRRIIDEVVQLAKDNNVKSGIITFFPHPDFVLGKRNEQGYLTPLMDQKRLLEQFDLDYMIVMPFNESFSKLTYHDFEERVLSMFQIHAIVIGFDYRYGYRGSGNKDTLSHKFNVTVISEITYDNQKMGSTLVREFLKEGKLDKANEILGRYFTISGIVSYGKQFGRKLGIPTANLEIENEYLHLKHGVYGVFVDVGEKTFPGVCNVGHNPSFNYVENPRIEVHILDWSNELYHQQITIHFVFYMREERYFTEVNDLKMQIQEDIRIAKNTFKQIGEVKKR